LCSPPHTLLLFCLILRPPPRSTLFPYTTLFRSLSAMHGLAVAYRKTGRLAEAAPLLDGVVRARRVDPGPDHPSTLAAADTLVLTDRKSTRLNSSHDQISYAVFCLKKKKNKTNTY